MRDFQQQHCKPRLGRFTNPLKSGADYPVRTDDPLITNRGARLKTKPFPVNRFPSRPYLSVTYPSPVNRIDLLTTGTAERGGRHG